MPSGRKVFRVCKRMEGEVVTVTLGAFSMETTQIEAVRRRARDAIRKIDAGINPNLEKKARAAAAITLDQAFTDYLDSRGDRLRESTQRGYEHVRDCYLEAALLTGARKTRARLTAGNLVRGRGRCWMHGGTNPGIPRTIAMHGRCSAESIAQRREFRALLQQFNGAR